jgi:hypothetical protein
MGVCSIGSEKPINIMLVGLQDSGKTFFLYHHLIRIIGGKDVLKTKPTECSISYFTLSI